MAIRITSAASNTLRSSSTQLQGGGGLWSMIVWVKVPIANGPVQTLFSLESTTVGTPVVYVRFTNSGNLNVVIVNGNNATVALSATGKIQNQWYAVAVTSTNTQAVTLYVWDHTGFLLGTGSPPGTTSGTVNGLQWGCRSTTNDLLDGTLAYGKIFGGTLTRAQLETEIRQPRTWLSYGFNGTEFFNPFDVAAASGYAYALNPYAAPQASCFKYGSLPPYDAGVANIPLVRQSRRRLRIRKRAFIARGAAGLIGVVFRRSRSEIGGRVNTRQQALN